MTIKTTTRGQHKVAHVMASLLLATTALGAGVIVAAPAMAQDTRTYDITAGPLADVLNQYARQAGAELAYHADLTGNASSPGLKGSYGLAEGLSRILAGTGITYRQTGPHAFTLEAAPTADAGTVQLGPVRVESDAGAGGPALADLRASENPAGPGHGFIASRSTSSTKTNTSLVETPQTVNVVTREQIDTLQPTTVSQALRYSPGLIVDYGGADIRDNVMSRGFAIYPQYLDGLPLSQGDFVYPAYDPYMLSRIEVIKGPSAALYGQSSPGGLLNMSSKDPTETAIHEIEIQGGSYGHFGGGLDFGGALGRSGDLLYRLVVTGFTSGSQVDHTNLSRIEIAPAVTWKPDDATTLTLRADYRYDPNIGFWNKMPAVGTIINNAAGNISDDLFTGDVKFNKFSSEQASAGYDLSHRFGDQWTFRSKLRYQYVKSIFDSVQADGLTGTIIDRDHFGDFENTHSLAMDNQLQGKFDTGPVSHTLLVGVDYRHLRDQENAADIYPVAPFDIAHPDYDQPIPDFTPSDYYLRTRQSSNQTGLYAQDQLALGGLRATLSVRHDWSDETTDNLLGGTRAKQSEQAWTWRGGVLYLFDNGLAPYFSYSESFQPQIGTDVDGVAFKPTRGKQYEAGLKYQPKTFDGLFTASFYDIRQRNVLTSDPSNPNNQIQTGEVRSRGIELEGKVAVVHGFDLTASYAYTDARIIRDNSGLQGKRPQYTPLNSASAWANYTFGKGPLDGFGVGMGARYTDWTFDQSNTLRVPSYTIFDAVMRYDLGKLTPSFAGASLALNGTNIFDKKYVQHCVNGCYYGLRRSILATLKYDW